MGKNDHARLPTVNKTMFDNGNWQAFTVVINYIADLTVWAATTKEKGIDGKKYNLLWLLLRDRDGPDGRGMMETRTTFLFLTPKLTATATPHSTGSCIST